MTDRYFVETPIEGPRARLMGPEAHHLAHVMRARPGDEVVLFDGGGAEFPARVEHVGRSEVELTILARNEVDRELGVAVTLGVALPKGERTRWLVEKSVELGVARLVPLQTERGNDGQSAASLARLRRAVVEASKQCGRNRLLEIGAPQRLSDFCFGQSAAVRWIAHPGAPALRHALDAAFAANPPRFAALAVGPEGGFSDQEIDAARGAGWQTVGLGTRLLRVETAAIALAAAIMLRTPSLDNAS